MVSKVFWVVSFPRCTAGPQHCWDHARALHMVPKSYGLYPSHDTLQVPTFLGPRTRITHGFQSFFGLYPSHDALQAHHCWDHARALHMVSKVLWLVSFSRYTAGPNIVGTTHAHYTWFPKFFWVVSFPRCTAGPPLLGPRTRITHGFQSLMGCILPTMHCRSQHCLELLHPFAHH